MICSRLVPMPAHFDPASSTSTPRSPKSGTAASSTCSIPYPPGSMSIRPPGPCSRPTTASASRPSEWPQASPNGPTTPSDIHSPPTTSPPSRMPVKPHTTPGTNPKPPSTNTTSIWRRTTTELRIFPSPPAHWISGQNQGNTWAKLGQNR